MNISYIKLEFQFCLENDDIQLNIGQGGYALAHRLFIDPVEYN